MTSKQRQELTSVVKREMPESAVLGELGKTTLTSVTGLTGGRSAVASRLCHLVARGDRGFSLLYYLM